MAPITLGNLSAFFAALFCLLSTGVGMPVSVQDKWYDPCGLGTDSPPTNVNLTEVMASMIKHALEIQISGSAFKTFLTAGSNPRVSTTESGLLDYYQVHVQNFPYDFESNSNPTENVTAVLITDYIYLSKVYIFFQQAKNNSIACDTRPDASQAQAKIQSILYKVQLTLCDVSTYLTASGHSMPADQIPDKDEVLDKSVPNMKDIHSNCDEDVNNTRNQADYLLARDTETTSLYLHTQYGLIQSALYSQSS